MLVRLVAFVLIVSDVSASALELELPEVDVGVPQVQRPDEYSELNETRISLLSATSVANEDILRHVPGVTVSRSGGVGQPSSVFIRGADAAGTLVLVDGVPVNDPGSGSHAYDFSTLSLENIERVEVWKGPQSVLFGSGATGGVVNIVSKKGTGPVHFSAGLLGGSQDTFNQNGSMQGASDGLSYALSAGHSQTGGISAAAPSRGGQEPDRSSSNSVGSRFDWQVQPKTELTLFWRWTEHYADLDYAPSSIGPSFIENDAPNFQARSRSSTLTLRAQRSWSSRFSSAFNVSRTEQQRSYRNEPDLTNRANTEGSYAATSHHLDNRNRWNIFPGGELLFGPAVEFESAQSDYVSSSFQSSFPAQSDSLVGGFVRFQWDREFYFLTAGARLDRHSLFGQQSSFELGPGLHLNANLDLFVRGSTAYKAPTLFELYDPVSGNRGLEAEQARTLEVALAQYFARRTMKFQVAVFASQYRNLIQFQNLHFSNLGSANIRGAELETVVKWRWLAFHGGYTYLETRDDSTGQRLARRPGNSAQLGMDLAPSEVSPFRGTLEFVSADRRLDVDPVTGGVVRDASYQVFNASLGWQATSRLNFYLKAINIFDLKYEEVAGYGSQPFSIYVGGVFAWASAR